MGLANHQPILNIVRKDAEYKKLFKNAFNKSGNGIKMLHVKKAIASFERTIISGNSAFDRFQYGGDKDALDEAEQRGLTVFLQQGRCVSCQCHPSAANTHPETYPKFQKQLGRVSAMWEMVNWCIRNPLEGKDLAPDSAEMISIQAYITHERRNVKLNAGKH